MTKLFFNYVVAPIKFVLTVAIALVIFGSGAIAGYQYSKVEQSWTPKIQQAKLLLNWLNSKP